MFRKILASLIFAIFVTASIPFFFGVAVGKTFLSPSFYSGALLDTAYTPLTLTLSQNIRVVDPVFAISFSDEDLTELIRKHFTKDIFRGVIVGTFDAFTQDDPSSSSPSLKRTTRIQLDLTLFVEPSRQFLKELIQRSFENIPPCKSGEQPSLDAILPSCMLPSWKSETFQNKFGADFEKAYQDKLFSRFANSSGQFSYDLEVTGSKSTYLSLAKTLDDAILYLSAFLLGLTLLLLLLWVKQWDIGFRWASTMWITSSIIGLVFVVCIFFLPAFLSPGFFDLPAGSPQYDQLMVALRILTVSFIKVYALFLFAALGVGIIFHVLHRRSDSNR